MATAVQIGAVQHHFRELVGGLHKRDCVLLKGWLRRTKVERFKTEEAALRAAEKALKPKARDWSKLWEILKKIIPFILPFLIK